MADIQLRGITKRFGDTVVIPDIHLTMPDGQVTVLLGPSGCGKSTLLRMIAGLETPTAGEVLVGGQVVNDVPPSQRGCALVFQNYALYPHKTVRQNLAFPLRMAKLPAAEQQQRVQDTAQLLELAPLLDRYPRQLSGGQRQRVAMGRAMIRRREVFLYDEPLSNLDLELRVRLRLEIARLQRQLKSTAVYVTHDQTEAMTLADQIVVLRQGRIEQVGPPLALYRHPANTFVAGFIGTPKMNLLDVVAQHEVPGSDGARLRLQLVDGSSVVLPRPAGGAAVIVKTLGFRPEHVRLGPPAEGEVGLALQGCETQAVEHLGDRAFCYLRSSLGELVVLAEEGRARVAGDVTVSLAPAVVHGFDAEGRAMAP